MWHTAIATDSYRSATEDRAAVVGSFAVVADGVGGRSGGATAAEMVVNAVRELAEQSEPWEPYSWMASVDQRVANSNTGGETTAVVAGLSKIGPVIVAVGDSVAWAVTADGCNDLTAAAKLKPWVGSGVARAVAVHLPIATVGTLLLATDGLVKYTSAEKIVEVIRGTPFDDTPRALIELVRPPSGRLPDDVAVIAARWETD